MDAIKILGSLLSNNAMGSKVGSNGSELLGSLLCGGTQLVPPQEAHDKAEFLIEAMCYAAKVDGSVDQGEKDKILGPLGDLDDEEIIYLREHLEGDIDVKDFTSQIPDDMDEQVNALSRTAIKLDTQAEAHYFVQLANGPGMDGDTCNQIHQQLGQPQIFA